MELDQRIFNGYTVCANGTVISPTGHICSVNDGRVEIKINGKPQKQTLSNLVYKLFSGNEISNGEGIKILNPNAEYPYAFANLEKRLKKEMNLEENKTNFQRDVSCNNDKLQCDMNEQWRTIPGFNGWYEISDRGNIYSFLNEGGYMTSRLVTKSKYYYVQLQVPRGTRGKDFPTHVLLYNAFHGTNFTKATEVKHIDGDYSKNVLSNLSA